MKYLFCTKNTIKVCKICIFYPQILKILKGILNPFYFLTLNRNNIKSYFGILIDFIYQSVKIAHSAYFMYFMSINRLFRTAHIIRTSVFNFIKDKISGILGNIGDFVKSVIDKLKALPSQALDIGKNLIKGLIDGIKNMAGKAVDTVKNVGKSLVNGIKGILKISSPSKVFEQIGEFTAEGFAIGYESSMDDFKSDMAMNMNGLTASMTADITAHTPDNYGGAGDTYNGGNVTINVYGAEGQNINDLAQEIAYRLESMTKRKGAVYA